jgi:hypothetical protein
LTKNSKYDTIHYREDKIMPAAKKKTAKKTTAKKPATKAKKKTAKK